MLQLFVNILYLDSSILTDPLQRRRNANLLPESFSYQFIYFNIQSFQWGLLALPLLKQENRVNGLINLPSIRGIGRATIPNIGLLAENMSQPTKKDQEFSFGIFEICM